VGASGVNSTTYVLFGSIALANARSIMTCALPARNAPSPTSSIVGELVRAAKDATWRVREHPI
jgi:hypothetical protein